MDYDELVELVAGDLTSSVSQMLIEMGSEDGQRCAKKALVEFASQAMSGAPKIGAMDVSTFTEAERHALAQASAMVLATIQADSTRPQ
jgi:hypothetical protein